MKKGTVRKLIRRAGIVLFVIYMVLMMYALFFFEAYGRGVRGEDIYRYNLRPFVEIRRFWSCRGQLGRTALVMNIFGNVLGFIPYGFILPVITNKMRSGFSVILSGFALSLFVETVQLVTRVGCFDVDDLLLNTLGAAIGYFAFAICDHLRRKHYGKKI